MTTSPTINDWWKSAVVYQVYPRSFADSNGDGIGDVRGIIDHLDHLVTLGVDALWISPWYPSPMADGGYDVSDYCDINPDFGTLADADALVAQAHELGLRVIRSRPEPLLSRASMVQKGVSRSSRLPRTRPLHLS